MWMDADNSQRRNTWKRDDVLKNDPQEAELFKYSDKWWRCLVCLAVFKKTCPSTAEQWRSFLLGEEDIPVPYWRPTTHTHVQSNGWHWEGYQAKPGWNPAQPSSWPTVVNHASKDDDDRKALLRIGKTTLLKHIRRSEKYNVVRNEEKKLKWEAMGRIPGPCNLKKVSV